MFQYFDPRIAVNILILLSIYKDKPVIINGCSDQKIPLSAYSVLLEKLQHHAKSIMFGEACSSVPIYKS